MLELMARSILKIKSLKFPKITKDGVILFISSTSWGTVGFVIGVIVTLIFMAITNDRPCMVKQ